MVSGTEAVSCGFFLVSALPGERCSSVLRLASIDESESESESATATLEHVSSEAQARIDEHTQHDTRKWITTTLADVTFVDDACFSFEADNPVSLVNSASTLLQIVDETCEAHGLPVNMNDGKTEFSIEMQFKHLWREDTKAHCISTKTGKSARVVSRYKGSGARLCCDLLPLTNLNLNLNQV